MLVTQVKERLATAPTTLALGVGMAVALLLGGCGDASPTRAAMAWSGDEPRVDDDSAPGTSEDAGTNDVVNAAAVPEVVVAPAAVPAPQVPGLASVGPNTATQTVQPVAAPPNLAPNPGKPQTSAAVLNPTPVLNPLLNPVLNPPEVLPPDPIQVVNPPVEQHPNQVQNQVQKQTAVAPQPWPKNLSLGSHLPLAFGSQGPLLPDMGGANSAGESNKHQAQGPLPAFGSSKAQQKYKDKKQQKEQKAQKAQMAYMDNQQAPDQNADQDPNDPQLRSLLNTISKSYAPMQNKPSPDQVAGNDGKGAHGGSIFGGAGGTSGQGPQPANLNPSTTELQSTFKAENQGQIPYQNPFLKNSQHPSSSTLEQINEKDAAAYIDTLLSGVRHDSP